MRVEVLNLQPWTSRGSIDMQPSNVRWISVVFAFPVSIAPSHGNDTLIFLWKTTPVPLFTWFGWGPPTPCYSDRHVANPASIPLSTGMASSLGGLLTEPWERAVLFMLGLLNWWNVSLLCWWAYLPSPGEILPEKKANNSTVQRDRKRQAPSGILWTPGSSHA